LVNSMLDAFEASLRAFQKHRELVLNQLQHRLSEYSHQLDRVRPKSDRKSHLIIQRPLPPAPE
jgi:hypothetical protein